MQQVAEHGSGKTISEIIDVAPEEEAEEGYC